MRNSVVRFHLGLAKDALKTKIKFETKKEMLDNGYRIM